MKQHKLLIAATALALFVRLAILYQFHDTQIFSGLTDYHISIAKSVLKGVFFQVESPLGTFVAPSINDTPFYGVLLGIIWKIFNTQSLLPIQIIQVFLDTFMTILIYATGSNFFNKKIGLLAAFLFAIYLPEAQLATLPLRDVFGSFGSIIFIYFLSKSFKTKSPREQTTALFTGVAITSICTLIRPSIALVPIFFIPFLLIKWPFKTALRNGLTILLTNIIFFWLPLSAVNLYNYDRPFVSPLGHGLLVGLGEFENPFGLERKDDITVEIVKNAGYDYTYGTPEFNDVLKNKALELIKSRPDIFITNLFKRIPKYLLMNHFFHLDYNTCRLTETRATCMSRYPSTYILKPFDLIFGMTPLVQIIFGLLALLFFPKKHREIIFCFLIPLNLFLATWQSGHEPRYILIGSHSLLFLEALTLYYFYKKIIPHVFFKK